MLDTRLQIVSLQQSSDYLLSDIQHLSALFLPFCNPQPRQLTVNKPFPGFEGHSILWKGSLVKQLSLRFNSAQKRGRGNTEPFTVASYSVHGCHPDNVWPKIQAERRSRLAAEYKFWFDDAGNLKPDAPKKDSAATQTPLTADTGAGSLHKPASAQPAPGFLQFPEKETA